MSDEKAQAAETPNSAASELNAGVGAWLPIETVPKDGSAVLVWLEKPLHHCRIVGATFHPNVMIVGGLFHFDAPKATHWMPPLDAPNEKVAENIRKNLN